ncbi:protein kinase [Luteipulveratus sp. YIM 133132]|uniref:non-specific serine/threonine protein kinase n=1 Tax=Luteipulveratus flavus TaxID=3031728 RepID=A0ABT6C6T6_9MICO|nr:MULTISPECIES: serine/threonine protein kinase [unclassified Luteipulveratus]MDE9366442.1 protein kinase [Luteipulveratus sp. YIM 133132]MDF8264283.1 protein kinase [Luteipulveratus sp. YIM 133296]
MPLDPPTSNPPVPPVIPGFRTGPFLGAGGAGEVWTVIRDSDGARLAAKMLHDGEDAGTELSLLGRIEHDHVLRLRDTVLVESGGVRRLALITELAEGGSLADAIAGRGHLTVGELVTVLCPVARAVHDLHSLGLVHGDLSPSNILLTDDGRPLIADLGVARLAGMSDPRVWGTEGFVAPEVLDGGVPEPPADVYALGAVAWTALVGRPPEPAALRPGLDEVAPQAPQALRDLVLTALAHTPESRPEPGELALRLWDIAAPEPAPVAGSTGRRAAPAADPAAGLTQRIRERAEPVAAVDVVAWWRQPLVARTAVVAGVIGAACAGYAAIGPSATGAGPKPQTVSTARPGPSATSGTPATAAPRSTARTPVSSTATPRPTATRLTSSASTVSRVPSPARAASTATARAAAPVPRPSSPTSGHPNGVRHTADPASAEAAGSDPAGVVQALADARARAWISGRESDLGGAFVTGSAAWTQDRGDLQRAAARSARYEGLTFTVRRAAVEVAGDHVLVDVMVDRSAYTLVEGSRRTTVPASAGEQAVVTLGWTTHGWRIDTWTPR